MRSKVPAWLFVTGSLALSLGLFGTLYRSALHDKKHSLQHVSEGLREISKNSRASMVTLSSVVTPDNFPDQPGFKEPKRWMGGTGILIQKSPPSPDGKVEGFVLTNHHLVKNAEKITLFTDAEEKIAAEIYAEDPRTDLAIVRVPDLGRLSQAPPAQFGNSDEVREGDLVIAVGTPFGLPHSVSMGVISARGRGPLSLLDLDEFLQTDAAINPGSSGGALLDTQGKVVGINTAIFSQQGGSIGIGFAIPSNLASQVAQSLLAHRRVIRGWLGISAQDVSPDLARYFHAPPRPARTGTSTLQGALINEVVPQALESTRTQLQRGDIITHYNSRVVESAQQLRQWVGATPPGQIVTVAYFRGREARIAQLTLNESPLQAPTHAQAGRRPELLPQKKAARFGLALHDVPTDLASVLKLPARQGTLVIGINPGGLAFEAGLVPGDVILSANQVQIRNTAHFEKLREHLSKSDFAVFYVQRGPFEKFYLSVRFNETPSPRS